MSWFYSSHPCFQISLDCLFTISLISYSPIIFQSTSFSFHAGVLCITKIDWSSVSSWIFHSQDLNFGIPSKTPPPLFHYFLWDTPNFVHLSLWSIPKYHLMLFDINLLPLIKYCLKIKFHSSHSVTMKDVGDYWKSNTSGFYKAQTQSNSTFELLS